MDIEEKIELIKNVNSFDARFVIKVLEANKKKKDEFEAKKNTTNIILKASKIKPNDNIIDLDKIWAKPYFYTKMQIRQNEMIKRIYDASYEEIKDNTKKFLKQIVFNKEKMNFTKNDNEIDIVDFIKDLDGEKNYYFIAENIDDETLFKEEQIKIALNIKKINDIRKQYEFIYDYLYDYLNKDFVSSHYCDFKNNKCIAQQKHSLYPISNKNGCCFRNFTRCPYLKERKMSNTMYGL